MSNCVDVACQRMSICTCPSPNDKAIFEKVYAKVVASLPSTHILRTGGIVNNALPLGFGKKVRHITITRIDDNPQKCVDVWNKIVSSKAIGVKFAFAGLELFESGLPHMHVIADITGRTVVRDIQKWNDGVFIKIQNVSVYHDSLMRVINYPFKEITCGRGEPLLNYLNQKNLSQGYYYNITQDAISPLLSPEWCPK